MLVLGNPIFKTAPGFHGKFKLTGIIDFDIEYDWSLPLEVKVILKPISFVGNFSFKTYAGGEVIDFNMDISEGNKTFFTLGMSKIGTVAAGASIESPSGQTYAVIGVIGPYIRIIEVQPNSDFDVTYTFPLQRHSQLVVEKNIDGNKVKYIVDFTFPQLEEIVDIRKLVRCTP